MMADTKKRELSEEEYESLAPSDRAHYDIKGRLGDGTDPEDSESTKVAREAAFSDSGDGAEPDPSSVTRTRSSKPGEGHKATVKGSGKDTEGTGKSTKKGKSSDR